MTNIKNQPFGPAHTQNVTVTISAEPILSTLMSMSLLTQNAADSEIEPWLQETADRLTSEQRRANRIVFEGMGPALVPRHKYLDFAVYLKALGNRTPAELRSHLPESPDDLRVDPDLRPDLDELLAQPEQMQQYLIAHLRGLWETEFEAQWQRKSTMIHNLTQMLNNRDRPKASAHDVIRSFIRRQVPDSISLQLAGVEKIIIVPAPHIRLHTARFDDPSTLWLFILADFWTMPLRTEPIQRSEVLGPLRALGDETRLQVLELLAAKEEMRAQEIIAHLNVGQSTVSRHLKQLGAAGFITEQRADAANKSYRLQPRRLQDVFFSLSQLLAAENAQAVLSDARLDLPKALHRFVDRDGLVTTWPRKAKDREAILTYLAGKFKSNQLYAEAEVNDLLNRWHTFNDPAHMRRELVDGGRLGRTSKGDRYWRER